MGGLRGSVGLPHCYCSKTVQSTPTYIGFSGCSARAQDQGKKYNVTCQIVLIYDVKGVDDRWILPDAPSSQVLCLAKFLNPGLDFGSEPDFGNKATLYYTVVPTWSR